MEKLRIHTNNVPRDLVYGYELTDEERKDFDYIDAEELACRDFFRYKGHTYDPCDFTTTTPGPWNPGIPEEFLEWDGYATDSFFSGILIRYPRDERGNLDTERVIVGWYCY